MRKLLSILVVALIAVSCQKEDIGPLSPSIGFEQVNPDNAKEYIKQTGCLRLPEVVGQWDWVSVHHAGQPVSDLNGSMGILQTIEITPTARFYPGWIALGEVEWSHARCNIVSGWFDGHDVFVEIQGDKMLYIAFDTWDVWYLDRH